MAPNSWAFLTFYFECLGSILHHIDMCCGQCQTRCQGCPQLSSVLTRRGLCSASRTQTKVPLKLARVLSLKLAWNKAGQVQRKTCIFQLAVQAEWGVPDNFNLHRAIIPGSSFPSWERPTLLPARYHFFTFHGSFMKFHLSNIWALPRENAGPYIFFDESCLLCHCGTQKLCWQWLRLARRSVSLLLGMVLLSPVSVLLKNALVQFGVWYGPRTIAGSLPGPAILRWRVRELIMGVLALQKHCSGRWPQGRGASPRPFPSADVAWKSLLDLFQRQHCVRLLGRWERCQGWCYLTSRASGTGGGLRVCPTSIRIYSGSRTLFQISSHHK